MRSKRLLVKIELELKTKQTETHLNLSKTTTIVDPLSTVTEQIE